MIPDEIKKKLREKYNIPDKESLKTFQKRDHPVNESEYPSITEFVIYPYVGAGVLLLGMTPDEVQSILNFNPRIGRRFNYGTNEYVQKDDYNCCFVYYKNPIKTCNFIDFYSHVSVVFNGKNLLNIPYFEALEFVKRYDNDIEINGVGFTSYKYGFGVYAEFAFKDLMKPVETVFVFEKGFY